MALFANLPAVEGKAPSIARGGSSLLMPHNPGRALGARVARPVRPQNLIAVARDLDAVIAVAAKTSLAIERTDPSGFGFDRIERIDAGEFYVEFGPGMVIERRKRPAA